MTIKLYYENPYLKNTHVTVDSIIDKNGEKAAILNKTIFYPEGGGQPWDVGTIGEAVVYNVQIEPEGILHFFNGDLKPNEPYLAQIDWERRFMLMQLHLGQHLLSASAMTLLGANTVGFHIGADYVTIDLDVKLDSGGVDGIEYLANTKIYENLPVTQSFPGEDEISSMPLRKIPKVEDDIRIVQIKDFDYTPCGGIHPNNTGEVGIVKVKKFWNHKSGTRIEFVAGRLALQDFKVKNNMIQHLSKALSAKEYDIVQSFNKIMDELKSSKDDIKSLKNIILENQVPELLKNVETINSSRVLINNFDDFDMNSLKLISSKLDGRGIIRALSYFDGEKSKFTLLIERDSDIDFNAKQMISAINDKTNGRGGGSEKSAQSSFDSIDDLYMAQEIIKDCLR